MAPAWKWKAPEAVAGVVCWDHLMPAWYGPCWQRVVALAESGWAKAEPNVQ